MITFNPAKMSFDERDRGSLTPGKIADFAVLTENPLTAQHIEEIQVKALYLAGKAYRTHLRGAVGLFFHSLSRRWFSKDFL